MITEGSIHPIINGPSRERLFDSVRLGQGGGDAGWVNFTLLVEEAGGSLKYQFNLRISGVRESRNGLAHTRWYFWSYVPRCNATCQKGYYVFGEWDTDRRKGWMKFSDKDFLVPEDVSRQQLIQWDVLISDAKFSEEVLGE